MTGFRRSWRLESFCSLQHPITSSTLIKRASSGVHFGSRAACFERLIMGMRRVLAGAGAVVLMTGGLTLAGAASASADQVWHQSVGRASANGACSTSSAADLSAGWSQWASSWEQWANGGKGGYTCTRSVTWALDAPTEAPMPAGDCTLIGDAFVVLDPSGFIPFGAPVYLEQTCTPPAPNTIGEGENRDDSAARYGLAWTTAGQAAADAICRAGNSLPYLVAFNVDENVYFCDAMPG
jgi:hypothetical protein